MCIGRRDFLASGRPDEISALTVSHANFTLHCVLIPKCYWTVLGCFAFTILAQLPAKADVCLTNGLLAHYTFNGDANDQTATRRDAAVEGPLFVADRFGNPNSALEFDGIDDYLRVTNTAGFPRGRAEFTVALWIFLPPEAAAIEHRFLFAVDGFQQWDFFVGGFWPGGSQIQSLEIYIGGGRVGGTESLSWQFNRWYHVAFVRNTDLSGVDTVRWFRDGTLLQTVNTTAGNNATDGEMRLAIGRRFSGYGSFKGRMDDFRIYDRPLSDSEVQELASSRDCPSIEVGRAVRLTYKNLQVGTNYQVEASANLTTWTNIVDTFSATSNVMSRYMDAETPLRFFRLRSSP